MQCQATTQTGDPCKMAALTDGEYCFAHEPGTGVERAKARKKGGENRYTPHFGDPSKLPDTVTTLGDANKILTYTLTEVIGMDNSIARARLLLQLYDSYVKSFEIGELEQRIAALEQRGNRPSMNVLPHSSRVAIPS